MNITFSKILLGTGMFAMGLKFSIFPVFVAFGTGVTEDIAHVSFPTQGLLPFNEDQKPDSAVRPCKKLSTSEIL